VGRKQALEEDIGGAIVAGRSCVDGLVSVSVALVALVAGWWRAGGGLVAGWWRAGEATYGPSLPRWHCELGDIGQPGESTHVTCACCIHSMLLHDRGSDQVHPLA
jgi:hypothetical protein